MPKTMMGSDLLIELIKKMLNYLKSVLPVYRKRNLKFRFFYSYDGSSRRRRERSKRSHHRHSPESDRKTRRHRHHRDEYSSRNKHRERVKEKDDRTPVKVKKFLFLIAGFLIWNEEKQIFCLFFLF